MLLKEVTQLAEMARPAKICPKCGKSMAGHHYWYKGGWKCKKGNLKDGEAAEEKKEQKKSAAKSKPAEKKAPVKKEAPASRPSNGEDEKEHKGVVKGLEREAGEEKDEDVRAAEKEEKKAKKVKAGERISADEMRDIDAESEAEARKQINNLFPKASAEAKTRALNVWKARHKKTNESLLTEATQSGIEAAKTLGVEIANDFAMSVRSMWQRERQSEFSGFRQYLIDMSQEEGWRDNAFERYGKYVERSFDAQIRYLAKEWVSDKR